MKIFKNSHAFLLLLAILTFSFMACDNDAELTELEESTEINETYNDSDFEATDWTTETHSKSVDGNFDEVFEDNTVKRFDIVISEDRWEAMLKNMTELYGNFGSSGGNQGGGFGGNQGGGFGGPPVGGGFGGNPVGGGNSFADEDPIFVPGEVFYNGKQWYRVGIRFKGNSSLQSSWQSGILKLSLKLDFDEFEDEYPQIDNQRFYGFKKLSLKNNYNDKSFLREKVAADIFRSAGLASSHTAFYTLYIDHGNGPEYFGLYTLVEEVDDTVIDNQFSDNEGNLYKPDGTGATFAQGSFTEDVFVKKTNEDDSDWSDIQALFTALHDGTRTADPDTWRSNLESVFDTDIFLNYLAVNTVIQNWDTYGRMTHNYFLYNNPETEKLSWIPWDNNEALQSGNMNGSLPLDFAGLNGSQWPLIGFLYADEVYREKYNEYVEKVITEDFNVSEIQALYTTYAALVEPYATTEVQGYSFLNNSSEFQSAISQLKSHVAERNAAAQVYLNQ
ncbi:CotH kinase family protein [Membranihabitans marinus]|uniref:CotH kinase family protein n=1 Tax=Membranihabitans marinus TaxID=1227546 RepID=UPI001F391226|nr:CotH kinase family protein [Membranihabitans marinus]